MTIDGKKIAEEILLELKARPKPKRFFAAFLVGKNPASEKFLAKKGSVAKELGIDFRIYRFPEEVAQDKLRREVGKVALAARCGGVIVQLPLPAKVDAQYVMNAIPREKDVDVQGERALGAFYAGRNPVLPPSVATFCTILSSQKKSLEGKVVAIVGAGRLVGKPISAWLEGKVKELIILDKGSDLSRLKNADLVVLGTGEPQLIKPETLKEEALVIDFGYGSIAGKVFGDLDASELKIKNLELKINFTPTPGGTGPILVAELFRNFFALTEKK